GGREDGARPLPRAARERGGDRRPPRPRQGLRQVDLLGGVGARRAPVLDAVRAGHRRAARARRGHRAALPRSHRGNLLPARRRAEHDHRRSLRPREHRDVARGRRAPGPSRAGPLRRGGLCRRELDYAGPVIFPEHHESHAASAFFPSPFSEAAFLTMDGVGEWATSSWGTGAGNRVRIAAELRFPHSLGLLYSAFTYFTGFKVNSGEYKLMGLAPYGEPKYVQLIYDKLLDLKPDGSFRMNLEYFDYVAGLRMTGRRFEDLFGGPARKPEAPLTQREMDIARSIQEVTEEIVLRMARHVKAQTGQKDLCLAGGVALNCVANGRLHRERVFDRLWIQPAAGDAGGALGAAYVAWHHHFDKPASSRNRDLQHGSS